MKLNKQAVGGKTKTSEFAKNGHRTRARFQDAGVGLLSVGSYVCPTINVNECERVADDLPNFKGSGGGTRGYIILSGTDTLVRPASKIGEYYRLDDGSVVTKAMFPKDSFEFDTVPAFKVRLKRQSFGVKLFFKQLAQEVQGIVFGPSKASGRGTMFTVSAKGKLKLLDYETRSNKHNAHLVASVVSTDVPPEGLLKQVLPVLA